MHAEAAGGHRHVLIAFSEHVQDMLATYSVWGGRVLWRLCRAADRRAQGIRDFIGVGGLRQIVDRASLHRRHRRRYVPVTAEDDGATFTVHQAKRGYHLKAIALFQSQIDQSMTGRELARDLDGVALGRRRADGESSSLHRTL